MVKTGTDWCLNADLMEFFEDSTNVNITPDTLTMEFGCYNEFQFAQRCAVMEEVIEDTIDYQYKVTKNLIKKKLVLKIDNN